MSAKRVNNTHFCQKTNQKKNTYKKPTQAKNKQKKTKQHMYRVKYKL